MPVKDQIVNYARKLSEHAPARAELQKTLRKASTITERFEDDGFVPNNTKLPLILYKKIFGTEPRFPDLAAALDHLFETNGWGRSWRASIYDFLHYHSQIHEVLGVAYGSASVEFGGVKGKVFRIETGDVVIIPAGTGHRLIDATRGFQVVGAYPPEGKYDECTDSRDRVEALKRISKVRKPKRDPVYGKDGPLLKLWKLR